MNCALRPLNSFLENWKMCKSIKTALFSHFSQMVLVLSFVHQKAQGEVEGIYHIILLGHITPQKKSKKQEESRREGERANRRMLRCGDGCH